MNLRSALRVIGFFLRVLIVGLVFIVDVKVRADIVIESMTGQVELENNSELLSPLKLAKLPANFADWRDFDVETSDNGALRLSLDGTKVAVAPQTFLNILKGGNALLSKGKVFLSIPKKGTAIKIQTPQGEVDAREGSIFIEVENNQTQTSVLNGEATLFDRASKRHVVLQAGFSSWLGGLLATGQRAHPLRPQAVDLDRIMATIRVLMDWSDKEYQSQYDLVKADWKDAVMKVAEDSQQAIDSDIKTLKTILANERAREERIEREHAKLRKLFREKTVGIPVGNTESPSGSDRNPASDLE